MLMLLVDDIFLSMTNDIINNLQSLLAKGRGDALLRNSLGKVIVLFNWRIGQVPAPARLQGCRR